MAPVQQLKKVSSADQLLDKVAAIDSNQFWSGATAAVNKAKEKAQSMASGIKNAAVNAYNTTKNQGSAYHKQVAQPQVRPPTGGSIGMGIGEIAAAGGNALKQGGAADPINVSGAKGGLFKGLGSKLKNPQSQTATTTPVTAAVAPGTPAATEAKAKPKYTAKQVDAYKHKKAEKVGAADTQKSNLALLTGNKAGEYKERGGGNRSLGTATGSYTPDRQQTSSAKQPSAPAGNIASATPSVGFKAQPSATPPAQSTNLARAIGTTRTPSQQAAVRSPSRVQEPNVVS